DPVAVYDANDLEIGTSAVGSGLLTITANGELTQTGALVQAGGGAQIFNLGGSIVLTDAGNDFVGPVQLVTLATGDASLTDMNDLTLSVVDVQDGNLTIVAGGSIDQSNFIGVSGDASFTAGNGESITLNHGNVFGGTVTLLGQLASAELNAITSIDLGGADVNGPLTVS